MNYYNEFEPYAAQWLRNLIAASHLPEGVVDETDIRKVDANRLKDKPQCHFFAGIGGWPYALRLAGWPANRPVWTGSCPCQPFSAAGKQQGFKDDRDLWPDWFRLIRECRPPVIFGEQVASAIGFGWLDRIYADLEGEGYAVGAAVLPACSVGAPHIRNRLFWVADAADSRRNDAREHGSGPSPLRARSEQCGIDGGLADATESGREARSSDGIRNARKDASKSLASICRTSGLAVAAREQVGRAGQSRQCAADGLGDADGAASARQRRDGWQMVSADEKPDGYNAANSWARSELIYCRDGKTRRIGAGIQPLAYGIPARVGKLRAAGNAIVAPLAAEFIGAFLEQ